MHSNWNLKLLKEKAVAQKKYITHQYIFPWRFEQYWTPGIGIMSDAKKTDWSIPICNQHFETKEYNEQTVWTWEGQQKSGKENPCSFTQRKQPWALLFFFFKEKSNIYYVIAKSCHNSTVLCTVVYIK